MALLPMEASDIPITSESYADHELGLLPATSG